MAVTVLLIRHGMTDAVGKYLAGRAPGLHLNDEGRRQVERLVPRISHVPIRAVVSSPLERTVETAEPIARDHRLPVELEPDLTEIDYGDWTGATVDDLVRNERWPRFNANRELVAPPGGELLSEVQSRAVGALSRMERRYGSGPIAVCSHGDVIRAVLLFALGMPLGLVERLQVSPARISVVSFQEDAPVVLQVNGEGAI
jgi:probable phosphoglycerate mutase